MDPLILLVWFLDDGSARDDCYAGKLNTQGFSKEENNLLKNYLLKWKIESNIVLHSRKKNQYYLYIPTKGYRVLMELISKKILAEIPSMEYKLNIKYKPRNDWGNL